MTEEGDFILGVEGLTYEREGQAQMSCIGGDTQLFPDKIYLTRDNLHIFVYYD